MTRDQPPSQRFDGRLVELAVHPYDEVINLVVQLYSNEECIYTFEIKCSNDQILGIRDDANRWVVNQMSILEHLSQKHVDSEERSNKLESSIGIHDDVNRWAATHVRTLARNYSNHERYEALRELVSNNRTI